MLSFLERARRPSTVRLWRHYRLIGTVDLKELVKRKRNIFTTVYSLPYVDTTMMTEGLVWVDMEDHFGLHDEGQGLLLGTCWKKGDNCAWCSTALRGNWAKRISSSEIIELRNHRSCYYYYYFPGVWKNQVWQKSSWAPSLSLFLSFLRQMFEFIITAIHHWTLVII